ncbi:pilus assembly protein TadG-related protein [Pseudomonas sp. UFMG81]|uniref:pilus assembly protein TadG-related protein n=1 Tax=Pseudomonas sp. UFMG81 TaxID=2745936 RepID=UPI002B26D23F|nr:pilus assembly protein TadG-related protein [Pseudomonas sp. UFMG81]
MVPRFAVRQRGAIGLMAALTLGLALLFMLLSVDSGRLYLEQRKLQRIADMAALEAAEHAGVCTGSGPQASALARTAATRNGHAVSDPLVASCGYLTTGAGNLRSFTADANRPEAIKVEVGKQVTTSVGGGLFSWIDGNFARTTNLHASAVAAKASPPQAMLSIRSSLATVNSNQGAVLNALLKALGGNTQLDLLGWQGIANTQLNLLKYLDQLAVDLHLDVGDYQQLLNLDTSATTLLKAAATVLQKGGVAADVTTNLLKVALDLPDQMTVGQLLNIQSGTAQAGLDTSIQLLQLVQGVILVATQERAVNAELPISILGLASGKVQLRIIEPAQMSAIGDPRTDTLRVHTAQIRALISLDLPVLQFVTGLLNAVLDLAAPLTNVLNNLLSLNLLGTVNSLTCALGVPCKVSDIILVPGNASLQVGLEVAQASSRLRPAPPDNYSCSPKSLTTLTQRSAAKLSVGRFDSPQRFLEQGSDPINNPVRPLPLIDIGTNVCSRILFLPPACGTRVPLAGGGIGVRIDSTVLAGAPGEKLLVFASNFAPSNIGQSPTWQLMDSNQPQVVASLSNTLLGVHLEAYKPKSSTVLGDVLVLTAGLLDGVKNILEPLIKNLLSTLLDPLLNGLLKGLGIDLATAQVGANLSCTSGHAQLVQ